MNQTGAALAAVAGRSVRRILRHPEPMAMNVMFPLVFLAIANASLGGAAPLIAEFPSVSYLRFALAGTLVLSGVSAGINAGADLAVDLQSGTVDRILLSPAGPQVLLAGMLAGPAALVALQAVLYLVVLAPFGATVGAGLGGQLVLVALVGAVAAGFGSIGAVLALRTGSSQAVLASFPAFFVLMIFSSYFLPRTLISADWFRLVATANPLSYVIEAGRSLVVEGWRLKELARGITITLAIVPIGFLTAQRSLRARARGDR